MEQITKITLQRGSEGPEVSYLQTLLKVAGYPTSSISGIFDFNTDSRVKSFQADHNLKINGIMDKETWKALEDKVNKLSEHSVGLKVPMLNITIPVWGVIVIGAIGVSSVVAFIVYLKKRG